MAYVELDLVVGHMFPDPMNRRVVDFFDMLHVKVYDRPFTGGDDDILLLERMREMPWL